ncbi:hypothetical protein [Pseudaeromonas paramecii]|uniref:Uncharacterized protein n=1 Tax=Pseudaeromonas paramecii TaxID=2138166 RepID=A0ABP8PUJ8_9GAMM
MSYVIATTESIPRFYREEVYDSGRPNWQVLEVHPLEFDHSRALLLTAETLQSMEDQGITIYDTKKEARQAYLCSGLKTCRYVLLRPSFKKSPQQSQ